MNIFNILIKNHRDWNLTLQFNNYHLILLIEYTYTVGKLNGNVHKSNIGTIGITLYIIMS